MAVMNFPGKAVMECVIETRASTILQFIQGLSGVLQVTLDSVSSLRSADCTAYLAPPSARP
jgi:hypothetical protein